MVDYQYFPEEGLCEVMSGGLSDASPQVVDLHQTLAQKDEALGKLEQSLRLMEEASFDGTFLWKITNVTRRCHESACGRTVSLFSPGNTPRGHRDRRGSENSMGSSQFCDSVQLGRVPSGHLSCWDHGGGVRCLARPHKTGAI